MTGVTSGAFCLDIVLNVFYVPQKIVDLEEHEGE